MQDPKDQLEAFAREEGLRLTPMPGQGSDYRDFPIVVVDDQPENLDAFELNFGDEFDIDLAESGEEALAILAEGEYALVISDQVMPGMTGTQLLEETARRHPDTVRIIVTGYTDYASLVDAINLGRIYRFVAKPWNAITLGITIRRAIDAYVLARRNRELLEHLRRKNEELEQRVAERTQELTQALERLEQLAKTDGLTGLFNHRHFQEELVRELQRARRWQEPVCVMMLDIDHFKNFNDTCGHPAGDQLLRRLSRLFGEVSRETDVIARYGGEEFAWILPRTDAQQARVLAERVRAAVENEPFERREVQPAGTITVSIGLASYPGDGRDLTEVLDKADRALYWSKHGGRNRVSTWSSEEAARRSAH